VSITFSCPDAPRARQECEFCAMERASRYPLKENGRGGCCDDWCDGTSEKTTSPTPNFSNVNARAILALLGMDSSDLCGSCDGATLRQRILTARGSDRSSALRDGRELQPGHLGAGVVDGAIVRRGCRVIEGGNTDEQTMRRLAALESLAIFAQGNGWTISWA